MRSNRIGTRRRARGRREAPRDRVATGTTSEIKARHVDTLGQWLADGAGWQAGRFEDPIPRLAG
jgi:hypothetical protein